MPRARTVVVIAGGAALTTVALAWIFRRQAAQGARIILDAVKTEAFKASLLAATPHGRALKYADAILQVAHEEMMNPFVLVGLMERESNSGEALTPPGPAGLGDKQADGYHGYGLFQLDRNGAPSPDSLHAQILADGRWADPYWNAKAAVVDHLRPDIAYFASHGAVGDQILQAALVAYNHGRGSVLAYLQQGKNPDALTTGKNYSADVLEKIAKYSDLFVKYGGSF